ncbi:MAG: hypothetical protein OHK0045_00560 [Raineya sp.]
MNSISLLVLILVALALVGLGVYGYLYQFLFRPAPNHPKTFLNKPKTKPRIVFAGDSLTCGNMSADFTNIVAQNLGNDYEYINAGINADLAYNLLQRLDEIIACQPDFVSILIGTNDANATYGKHNQQVYSKLKKLPHPPSLFWYEENLQKIIERLQKETSAKIALISMPLIGETLDHQIHQHLKEFVAVVKKVAHQKQVAYLPMYETHLAYLEASNKTARKKYKENHKLIESAMLQHYIFGKTWDQVSKSHGFQTLTDFLHLNSWGANTLANLVGNWVKNCIIAS